MAGIHALDAVGADAEHLDQCDVGVGGIAAPGDVGVKDQRRVGGVVAQAGVVKAHGAVAAPVRRDVGVHHAVTGLKRAVEAIRGAAVDVGVGVVVVAVAVGVPVVAAPIGIGAVGAAAFVSVEVGGGVAVINQNAVIGIAGAAGKCVGVVGAARDDVLLVVSSVVEDGQCGLAGAGETFGGLVLNGNEGY